MASNSQLVTLLKNAGYSDNNVIRKIVAAAEAAESERLASLRAVANHDGMYELPSPLTAAESDPRKASIIRTTAGMIRNATRCKYSLPMDRSVDVSALRAALREAAASTSTTMSIVENLFACGLVPA